MNKRQKDSTVVAVTQLVILMTGFFLIMGVGYFLGSM